jgi:hypothetical protein
MFHVREMNTDEALQLSRSLAAVSGVTEAVVIAQEGVAYLKVEQRGWDESGVMKLIEGTA